MLLLRRAVTSAVIAARPASSGPVRGSGFPDAAAGTGLLVGSAWFAVTVITTRASNALSTGVVPSPGAFLGPSPGSVGPGSVGYRRGRFHLARLMG